MYDIIIDADTAIGAATGLDVDDDLAVLYALASPEVNVLGLTITYGNASISQTYRDALRLMELADETDIPVLRGAGWLTRDVHRSTDASRFLVETILSRGNGVTIVSLGPMTNLAAAITQEPLLEGMIDRIILMGGILRSDKPEFNFAAHPKASDIVLAASTPKIVIPIDTCVQVAFTRDQLEFVKSRPESVVYGFRRKLEFFIGWGAVLSRTLLRDLPGRAGGGFHPWDVVAMAYLTTPGIFTDERCYTMSMNGRRVVSEPCDDPGDNCNRVIVPTRVDAESFLELMLERICAVSFSAPD